MLTLFISQKAAMAFVSFFQIRSGFPSFSKSPSPRIFQSVDGLPGVILRPFINRTATTQLVCCQIRSIFLSPPTSPIPLIFQSADPPRKSGEEESGAVHQSHGHNMGPKQRNTVNSVAEVPNEVDHNSVAGSFGSIHAVGSPAGNARAVAAVVHAVVGTTYRSLAKALGWRGPAVAGSSSLEDSGETVKPVARDPPPTGPKHCLPQTGNIQRILWLACGSPPVNGGKFFSDDLSLGIGDNLARFANKSNSSYG